MDTIDEVLAMNAISSKYTAAIIAALSIGKKTLNHYYEKTNLSHTYRIVMSTLSFIHPHISWLQISFFQSFILITSSPISKKRSGRATGLRLPCSLYKPSLTFPTVIPLLLREQSWIIRCVLTTFVCHTLLFVLYRLLWTPLAHQKSSTCLTTWPHSLHLSPQSFMMSLIATSALTWCMLLMLFIGVPSALKDGYGLSHHPS